MDEYTYYRWGYANNQRWCDRSASHFGRFTPQTRPLRCAICMLIPDVNFDPNFSTLNRFETVENDIFSLHQTAKKGLSVNNVFLSWQHQTKISWQLQGFLALQLIQDIFILVNTFYFWPQKILVWIVTAAFFSRQFFPQIFSASRIKNDDIYLYFWQWHIAWILYIPYLPSGS